MPIKSSLLASLTLLLGICCLAAEPEEATELKLSKEEKVLVDLTNQARAKENLKPLKPNALLFKVARAHAANMAKHEKMQHDLDGKTPKDRIEASGYDYGWVGENIAETYEGLRPRSIFKQWMGSKPHRENILRPQYAEIGIGIARSKDGNYYYAQEFGSQRRHHR